MIDLHLHTTASDGTDTPAGLVRACRGAGITAMAVTDHDTTAAVSSAEAAAREAGIGFVAGIEITAAWNGRDIHVLGYFIDPESPGLTGFLAGQIRDRIRRARAVGDRLAALGAPIDMEALVARLQGRPVLRPDIAQALAEAGHVRKASEAFELYIGEGRPAYVARRSATPAEVVAIIHRAGGVASIAHPGVSSQDALIPELAATGLDALEAYHTDHSAEDTGRYLRLAGDLHLAVTGGSDYHGALSEHSNGLGTVCLPDPDFAAFSARARRQTRG
jgi:3',5'-nucleoside bisphosphate phosphatase